MSITVTEQSILPVRRDKQIASNITTMGGGGGSSMGGGGGGSSTLHNLLSGKQGNGVDFYHLDATQYNSMVFYSGTPVDNQVALFSTVNTLEGSVNLTFDGTTLVVTGNQTVNKITLALGATNGIQFGDGDSGLYENSDDVVRLAVGGVYYSFNTSRINTNTGTAFALSKSTSSATVPTLIPHAGSLNTGIGGVSDTISLICNSVEMARVNSIGIGAGAASASARIYGYSATSGISGVFGSATVTTASGIGIGVDAESNGVNTGTNYGLYAAAGNATNNSAIYIEVGWPPAGTYNYAIKSLSVAQSYFAGKMVFDSDIQNPTFTSGFQGSNWQITEVGNAEFNNVRIRGGLQVYELIINQLHYQNGGLIIGAGAGKVAEVIDGTQGSEILTFEDPEGDMLIPFTIGAIITVQRVDLDRQTVIKKLVRQVSDADSSSSGHTIEFTATTGWTPATDDVGVFEVGDEVVAIGHVSDTTLDSSIYISATDANNPFLRVYDAVSTYAKWSLADKTTIKLQLGNLESLAGYSIVPASPGYGLYSDNVYLQGKIVATAGSIGALTIDADSIYTGTKYSSLLYSPFTVDGLTIGSDGSIRTPTFYVDEDGDVGIKTEQPHWVPKVASANVRNSHDSEQTTDSTDYTILKGIVFSNGLKGVHRYQFKAYVTDMGYPGSIKLCKDGVMIGSEVSIIGDSYGVNPYTQDITVTWEPDEELQLYGKTSKGDVILYVKEFRVLYDDGTTDVIAVKSHNSTPK